MTEQNKPATVAKKTAEEAHAEAGGPNVRTILMASLVAAILVMILIATITFR